MIWGWVIHNLSLFPSYVICYPNPVSLLLAVLLSLHLVTFYLCSFFFVSSRWAEVCHRSEKIPGFLGTFMQYGLNNHWCRHLIKHQFNMDWQCQLSLSLCTLTNFNSVILSNAYISLLSALFSSTSTTSEQNNIAMFLRTCISTLWDFDVVKTAHRDHAMLSVKCCYFDFTHSFWGGTLNIFLKFIW